MLFVRVSMCVVASAGSLAAADITYSDGTFANSGWGFELVQVGSGGSGGGAQQIAGGNPDFCRRITNTLNAGSGAVFGVSRYGTTTDTRYDPLTQGAIRWVDFAIDHRLVTDGGGSGASVMLAAKQGVVVYIAAMTAMSGPDWATHSLTRIEAAEFTRADGLPGSIDFSATGAPMRFGFAMSTTTAGPGFQTAADFDNFLVRVRQVPGPGSAAAFAVSLIMTAGRRRRASTT